MDIVEGFFYLIIIFEFIAGLVGLGVLSIVYVILKWTGNRWINLGILGIGLVLGGIYLTPVDAPGILLISLFFSLPLAVLVPPAIQPIRDGAFISFEHVVPCYAMVWTVGAVLPWVLVGSRISMNPFIYWHTPLSNALLYALAVLLFIVLAAAFYRLIRMHSSPADHQ